MRKGNHYRCDGSTSLFRLSYLPDYPCYRSSYQASSIYSVSDCRRPNIPAFCGSARVRYAVQPAAVQAVEAPVRKLHGNRQAPTGAIFVGRNFPEQHRRRRNGRVGVLDRALVRLKEPGENGRLQWDGSFVSVSNSTNRLFELVP